MNKRHLIYLLDPLCGWCYGAAPRLEQLREAPEFSIMPMPGGLFAREGARVMTPEMKAHIRRSDLRVAELSGLTFSDVYRTQVLEKAEVLDSFTATLALIAVREDTARQWALLQALQHGRYVLGIDSGTHIGVTEILMRAGFEAEALAIVKPTEALLRDYEQHIRQAQALTAAAGVNGVPALLTETEYGWQQLSPERLFGASIERLKEALLGLGRLP